MPSTVNTARVKNRRRLRFNSLQDMLADVVILSRERSKICSLGNWSAGQILEHLARTMNKSIDGFETQPAWLIQLLGRWHYKRRVLQHGMRPGFLLKGKAAEEFVPPRYTTFDEGFEAFRRAVRRLQTEPQRVPSPIFGPLTIEEWTELHLRHAELHLSFLMYEETNARPTTWEDHGFLGN